MAVTAIEYLVLGTEQFLRELRDDEFDALVARCRPPVSRPASTTSSTNLDRASATPNDEPAGRSEAVCLKLKGTNTCQ